MSNAAVQPAKQVSKATLKMRLLKRLKCTTKYEKLAWTAGAKLVAGVDEVGRGSLFGPVVAGAVILDPNDRIKGLRDSKLLPADRREVLAERIKQRCIAWAVAAVDVARIDQINIYHASRLAMVWAIEQLKPQPDHLLIDAMLLDWNCPQTKIIHGDALSASIAAASIVAKVERDRMITAWDVVFPVYGLASNKRQARQTGRHAPACRLLPAVRASGRRGPPLRLRSGHAPASLLESERRIPTEKNPDLMVTAAAGVPTDSGASKLTLPRLAWVALLLIFFAVYVGAIFSPALLDDADATHAEAAREMAATGDWVTLHINGVRYLEKAPLMYWISAASFKIFGVSTAAARLPIVLGIFGAAFLAGIWSRRAFGELAGIYAALFVLTTAGIFLFTRILIPEILLTLFIGTALYGFLTGLEDHSAWRIYAGYAATALAVLTKGLVALAFVGGTAAVHLAISGEWRRWREFRLLTGLTLLFAIAAPWHILATERNPGFFWFYFINEHFLRFLGKRWPKDYNKMPAIAYWTAHLAWLFPWSLFGPLVVRDALHTETEGVRWIALWRTRVRPLNFEDRTRLLCLVWAGLILVFFAFSTNQEYYTFPAYLPLLILVAGSLGSAQDDRAARRWVVGAHVVLLIVGCAASIALISGLWSSRNLPFVPDIGEVLVQRGVGNYTLSMSHFFDLTDASFAALRLPAAIAAVALVAGPLAGLWFCLKRRRYAAVWSVALGMAGLLVAAHIALERFEPYLSSRALAARIAAAEQPGDRVMIYGDQAFGSSLLFYLRQPIELVNGRSTSMAYGSTYPDAPKIFLTGADLEQAWNGPRRVFLFVPEDKRAQAEKLLPQAKLFAQMSGKVVYTNR